MPKRHMPFAASTDPRGGSRTTRWARRRSHPITRPPRTSEPPYAIATPMTPAPVSTASTAPAVNPTLETTPPTL